MPETKIEGVTAERIEAEEEVLKEPISTKWEYFHFYTRWILTSFGFLVVTAVLSALVKIPDYLCVIYNGEIFLLYFAIALPLIIQSSIIQITSRRDMLKVGNLNTLLFFIIAIELGLFFTTALNLIDNKSRLVASILFFFVNFFIQDVYVKMFYEYHEKTVIQ